jgi:hypothetical protein
VEEVCKVSSVPVQARTRNIQKQKFERICDDEEEDENEKKKRTHVREQKM